MTNGLLAYILALGLLALGAVAIVSGFSTHSILLIGFGTLVFLLSMAKLENAQ